MLMYLASNAHPEIQFSVHQCARFCHAPHHTLSPTVKRVTHYLKGVLDQEGGLHFESIKSLILYSYVDADYAGLWTYEDNQDLVCVKSRTGYIFTLGDFPIHWCSKLQIEVV